MYKLVKQAGVPNFVCLHSYWDQQLLQFIKFGFPIGFNRECPLQHTSDNDKSAIEYPTQVQAYIQEELQLGAIISHFVNSPTSSLPYSPIMTRPKPNSGACRIIMDLSCPKGCFMNDRVDKDGYLTSSFSLTFPTIDHLTDELTKIGHGAHIFKVDVRRAFHHLKVDPMDIDLLGLNWNGHYVDMCIPFGTIHGSKFCQCTSNAVHYVMRQLGHDAINYINDFLGFGMPNVAHTSFDTLRDVMRHLGLTVCNKNLSLP